MPADDPVIDTPCQLLERIGSRPKLRTPEAFPSEDHPSIIVSGVCSELADEIYAGQYAIPWQANIPRSVTILNAGCPKTTTEHLNTRDRIITSADGCVQVVTRSQER